MSDDIAVLSRVRRLLLAILAAGIAGTGLELLLIGHFEELTQIVPLVLLATGLIAVGWQTASRSAASALTLRAIMALFVISGGVGIALHYRGNVEFELEMYPSMAGMELVSRTLTGATPVFAPGTMTLLGLIGLTAVYDGRR